MLGQIIVGVIGVRSMSHSDRIARLLVLVPLLAVVLLGMIIYRGPGPDVTYLEITTCDATTIRLAKCVAVNPDPKRCLSTCDQQRITSLETEHGITIEISTCLGNPKFICQYLCLTILGLTLALLFMI